MTASQSTQAAKQPWLRAIAKLLMLAQVLYPIAGIAPAGQRPIIDAAQNGVPIVHIAPPSAGGVSRNQYSQFNVGSNGLILNNSSTNVQTQLAGWISGNMQLGPTPARIILNEVVSSGTGNSASQLKGFIEVAGQRADIVIANPNGVSCDGCGFLNTNGRATLTTGTPQFGAQGELTGFNVGQGQINIGSGGLNATNLEQLDLIARGLVIEGEVWAKNLQVVAGANQVLYGTLNATSQTGTGAAPSFAIDIKELGGMYANQIYMVATEQGLGVNSTGRIAALQGNLSLNANGDLSLKDSYAKQDLQLASSGHTMLTGATQSEGRAQIQTTGTLTQQGVIVSTGPLGIAAASLNNTGTLYSAGTLNVAAAQVNDTNGRLISAGDLTIAAQGIALSGTQLSTDTKLALAASAGDVSLANAQVYAGADIAASASGSVANSGGFVQSGGSIAVQAGSVANRGGTVLASGALRVSASDAIDNTGGKLMGGTAVDLSAASLVNDASSTSQALIASDQGTRITTSGSAGISNRGGVLSGKTELVVATTGGALDNTGGTLVSDNALRLR
jgi:filamentous hemagglutinin